MDNFELTRTLEEMTLSIFTKGLRRDIFLSPDGVRGVPVLKGWEREVLLDPSQLFCLFFKISETSKLSSPYNDLHSPYTLSIRCNNRS